MYSPRQLYILQITGISFCILFFPPFLHYNYWGEMDFSPLQIWENLDSDIQIKGFDKKGGFWGSNVIFMATLFFIVFFKGFSRFVFSLPARKKKARLLRC